MNIVIVESPAKAKTVNRYLGSAYRVLASYGHVRDLPSKNGSVLPDKDFEMHWDVEPKAAKRLDEIAQAVKGANRLILATDPDREGEAIAWHLLEVLLRHPGKLLTQEFLLREVWGPGYGSESNYLRVYVGQLRKKLGDDAAHPRLILTEPGIGYRWIAGEEQAATSNPTSA